MPWESGVWTAYEVCNGTITDIMSCSNDNTGGIYGVLLLATIWAILFFSLSIRDFEKGLAASSLITTIIAMLMAATDPPIVAYPIAMGFVIITIVSVMLLYGSKGGNGA